MLKSKEQIQSDIISFEENDFYKYALLVVEQYDENYLIKERQKILDKISSLSQGLNDTDFYGMNASIRKSIRELRKGLKIFKYLLK